MDRNSTVEPTEVGLFFVPNFFIHALYMRMSKKNYELRIFFYSN